MEVLCQSLNHQAPACKSQTLNPEFEDYSEVGLSTFFWKILKYLTLLAIFAVLGFYFYYKMKTRGKMEKEIEKRVNSAILKYYGNSEFSEVNQSGSQQDNEGTRKRKPSDENV